MRHRSLAPILISALLWAGSAGAQRGDAAAAEQLFSAGREAFERGDFASACPKFEESPRLDPAAGTLINLAACYEKLGRLASAWETWRGALQVLAPGDERRPAVERRAEAMEKRVPRLFIELASGAPPDTRVTRDSVDLGAASLGVGLPVDPGRHLVIASAPGHLERRYDVEVAEGAAQKLVVEPGEARTAAPAPSAAAPVPTAPPVQPAPLPDRPTSSSSSSTRTLGYVVGTTGLLGILAGSVTGIIALQKKNAMLDDCERVNGAYACGPDGLDAASSGETFATVSTIAFAAGAVATGAGLWLILSSSEENETALVASPTSSGAIVGLSGRY
jgi:hypothetical protein